MLGFDLGSCWPPHIAHHVATTRAAGMDLQILGSQPLMPKNLPDHWQAGQGKDLGEPLAYLTRFPWVTNGFALVVSKWSSPRHVIWPPHSLPLVWVSGGILGQSGAPVQAACRSCGMVWHIVRVTASAKVSLRNAEDDRKLHLA